MNTSNAGLLEDSATFLCLVVLLLGWPEISVDSCRLLERCQVGQQ